MFRSHEVELDIKTVIFSTGYKKAAALVLRLFCSVLIVKLNYSGG